LFLVAVLVLHQKKVSNHTGRGWVEAIAKRSNERRWPRSTNRRRPNRQETRRKRRRRGNNPRGQKKPQEEGRQLAASSIREKVSASMSFTPHQEMTPIVLSSSSFMTPRGTNNPTYHLPVGPLLTSLQSDAWKAATSETHWCDLADEHKFVVVFPEGKKLLTTLPQQPHT